MKILFWNTYKNTLINSYIASLINDNDIDIVILAEYRANVEELYRLIRKKGKVLNQYVTFGCTRVTILGLYEDVEPSIQDKYYSIQIIKGKLILCGVHLPSDLHGNRERERSSIIRRIINDVQYEEKKISAQNTIIVGDFNEMPYGNGCLSADALHGLPVFDVSSNRTRRVLGSDYSKYYNPMWNFFGDFSYPPGTYYRNDSSLYSPIWYIFDQFIFGQDIIPCINKKELKIITRCSYGSLSDKKGHPDKKISDHFPIMCEILEQCQNGGLK